MRLRGSPRKIGVLLATRCMADVKQSITAACADGSTDLALSFSGCGFLGTYHFGVLSCLHRNGKGVINRVRRVAGTSAGALAAAITVLAPYAIEESVNEMYKLADELSQLTLGALTPGFLLNERLTKIVSDHLPLEVLPADDRLFISVTKQEGFSNVLMSKFDSRDHLVKCLAASCFIPMYSMGFHLHAPRPVIHDQVFIDGGYTNNLPVFDDMATLTVSPFSGAATIAPIDRSPLNASFEWRMVLGKQEVNVNMQNIVRGAQALFPPSVDVLRYHYKLGFNNAFKFLVENGIVEREEGTAV